MNVRPLDRADRARLGRPVETSMSVENAVVLTASPLRVWTLLTDFARQAEWKPFIRLAGDAHVGGSATYSFHLPVLDRSVSSDAEILTAEKPDAFAWAAGLSKMLQVEEWYELADDPAGTRMVHSLRFAGIFARPLLAMKRRKLEASLAVSDRCLDRHLRRLAAQPNRKPRLPVFSHGGGKKHRRRR